MVSRALSDLVAYGIFPVMPYSRTKSIVTKRDTTTRSNTSRRRYVPDDDRVVMSALNGKTESLLNWLGRVESRFYGTPEDIHPCDALLLAIRVTAGEVRYADAQISSLTEDELFERPLTTKVVDIDGVTSMVEVKRDMETISRWVSLRQNSLDRLARYSRMAIELGLSEREVALAAGDAKIISLFIGKIMDDLNMTSEQRAQVAESMRRHSDILESPK